MDMQQLIKIRFFNPAPLASMAITLASAARLPIPVWPVVRIEPTAPCWVLITFHALLMAYSKAFAAAKRFLIALNLVWLALKCRSAYSTRHCNASRLSYQTVCSLPSSAALAVTKIVFFNSAWRYLFLLAAPLACNDNRRPFTCLRTVVFLLAFNVPTGAVKFFTARFAMYQHKMLLYGFAMLYYSIKDRPYAGDENNVIARARIAYWQQRRYELLDPATPITIKSAPAQPDGQLDMFESEAA